MGDMGEMFKAWNKAKKEKKLSNQMFSYELVNASFDKVEQKNGGVHLICHHNERIADFWPSTGKYSIRGTKKYKRGVKNLIREMLK